ncbi:MAG: SRPBCC domain-containing protein [Chthoniobacteraceae bacterium]
MSTTLEPLREEILITRTFDAPPSLVFRAWTIPQYTMNWWGCDEFRGTHMEMDVRPGGKWRCCLKSSVTGEERWMHGVYREVSKFDRISFTFAWELEGDWGRETVVTVNFVEEDGKTRMFFRHGGFVSTELCNGHEIGWTSGFTRLVTQLAEVYPQLVTE